MVQKTTGKWDDGRFLLAHPSSSSHTSPPNLTPTLMLALTILPSRVATSKEEDPAAPNGEAQN